MTDAQGIPETSTIAIPFDFDGKVSAVQKSLNEQEQKAIDALPEGSALLITRNGPHEGMRFLLDEDTITVGRHPDADIFLDDVTVSRRHATFNRRGTDFEISDEGSMNGIYVNGDRVDNLKLQSGSELQIGKFPFTYYTKWVQK